MHCALENLAGQALNYYEPNRLCMQGDVAKARAAYQEFFKIWKETDSDITILK